MTGRVKRDRTRRASVTATEAQNNFGRVLSDVARGEVVYITRYDRPEAVVLSMDRFEALSGAEAISLDALTQEFDQMLARMQTPEAAAGAEAFFGMGDSELGEAAVGGARK
jgi:antitoxin Phd